MNYNVLKTEMKGFLGDIINSGKFCHLFVENPSVGHYLRKCVLMTKKYSKMNDYLEYFLKKYRHNININEQHRKKKETLLHLAIRHIETLSTKRTIKILINAGIDINLQNYGGVTALHIVCDNNTEQSFKIFKILINASVNVNLQDNYNSAPLHYATFKRPNEITVNLVEILINAGANVDLRDNFGSTSLHYIADKSPNEITVNLVEILINAGADIDLFNVNGQSPLHHAVEKSNNNYRTSIVKLLVSAGADVFGLRNNVNTQIYVPPIELFDAELIKECEIDIDTRTIGIITGKMTKCAVIQSRE